MRSSGVQFGHDSGVDVEPQDGQARVTRFPGDVRDDKDLVEALRAGEFEAISWK